MDATACPGREPDPTDPTDPAELTSARRRAAELESELELALDAAGMGRFRWDRRTGATDWDARLEALFGMAPGSFPGTFEAWVAGLHPEDRAAVLATVERAVDERSSYLVEHRVVWPDGTVRWVQGRGTVLLDADGEVTGTVGCTWDVTDRVELQQAEQRARDALAAALQAERVHRQRLEFLAEINGALGRGGTECEIVRAVAEAAVPRLGDWCSVHVLPDHGDEPVVEVAHRDPEMVAYARQLQERFPYDPDAPAGVPNVIRTGTTEFYPNIDEQTLEAADATAEARDVLRALALRSAMVAPIAKGGRVLGAIQFVSSGDARPYTADDVTLAETVGGRLASAIVNRRLTDQLHRDRFRAALDALLDDVTIARAVRAPDGSVEDFVIEFVNSSRRDPIGRGPDQMVGRNLSELYPGWATSTLRTAYTEALELGRPVVLDRLRYDDVAEGARFGGWYTVQVVPFDDGILVCSRDETAAVQAERDVAEARAEQTRARLAMELLQAAALPATLPTVPGLDIAVRYEPADRHVPVGGDWYDVFAVPGDAVGVVIADVAGHGHEAAALMVQVRNVLRAFASTGASTDEVMARTNAVLCALPEDVPFVTCCYLVLDPGLERVRWSSAGHPPPVLGGPAGAAWLPIAASLPLGIAEDVTFVEQQCQLDPGDAIVLFTDGLVERRGEPLDTGVARVRALVEAAAGRPADDLVADLMTTLVPEDRPDDVALVVIRRDSAPAVTVAARSGSPARHG